MLFLLPSDENRTRAAAGSLVPSVAGACPHASQAHVRRSRTRCTPEPYCFVSWTYYFSCSLHHPSPWQDGSLQENRTTRPSHQHHSCQLWFLMLITICSRIEQR